jgi:hypothetical protein
MWRRYVIGNPLFLFRVWRQTLTPGAVRAAGGRGGVADAKHGTQQARSMQRELSRP